VKHVKLLDELNPGNLAGLTRSQIKEQHSKWFSDRELDKIRHRYPGTAGEGYHDVTQRLKSTILEVERVSDDVVLLSGLAVVRLLIAYFKGLKQEEIPDLDVPIGTVYMFEPVSSMVSIHQLVLIKACRNRMGLSTESADGIAAPIALARSRLCECTYVHPDSIGLWLSSSLALHPRDDVVPKIMISALRNDGITPEP
jgi:hypothetical protein